MSIDGSQAKTVLIADDDPDIQALVALRLERAGYRTVLAGDGQSALELALAEPPDLAVVDWSMPRLDGIELTRALRAHAATAEVPVLLLTARAMESDAQSGYDAGVNAYVQKPFPAATLREWVVSLLDRSE
jgi:DNA-binding response OmpR family regulator